MRIIYWSSDVCSSDLSSKESALSSVLSAVEAKLAFLPLPVQLIMPYGQKVGSPDAEIRLTVKDRSTLAHLATGQVGGLGEDYVEGKFDIDGPMRDLMRLACRKSVG